MSAEHSQPGRRILVIDDDAAVVDYLCESLATHGYETAGMTSPVDALARIVKEDFDLIITDVEMPDLRGPELLSAIFDVRPAQLVLLITAYGSMEMAVAAVRAGACDFLAKPFKIEALVYAIERAFSERMLKREIVRLRSALNHSDESRHIVARSPAMRRTLDVAKRIAKTNASVLLTGETGSGKSLLARYIHDQSSRREEPFVQLNCAAVPSSLAESELFGVRRGAFTGAHEDRDGLFVAASSGTLFLDEIGELSLEIQAKLLHVLEAGVVRPLGGSREVPIKTRVVTATNHSPESLLRDGRFRPDLYYRINVVRIEVPPLRERRDDILPLVDVLLSRASEKHERPLIGVSAKAVKALVRHSWPGNVRELANVIERAVAMAEHDTVLPEDLDFPIMAPNEGAMLPAQSDDSFSLEEVELAHILRVLDAVGGNKAAAARRLGITRRTLYRKLNE